MGSSAGMTRRIDREGDPPGALYALYRAERGPLLWYLRARGVAADEAEDAVQAAFVRLLRATGEVREPRAWLRVVALNEYRRSSPGVPGSRRRAVVVPVPPADLPDTAAPGHDPVELSGQARWAAEAVAALPDKQRAVMARHLDGQSHQQIADELGTSNATVRQNLRRGRKALGRLLDQERTDDQ
jgi:RNA polymerase sigma factor (sigma-70 family)